MTSNVEIVGRNMPAVCTLDDLAAMMGADPHGNRYEMSPDGAVTITPLPDSGHAKLVTELMCWLFPAVRPVERVLHRVGLRIRSGAGEGGRVPDVTVWKHPPSSGTWLSPDDLNLVVEIESAGTVQMDRVIKAAEYASVGIPQYWTVARDAVETVSVHVLEDRQTYELKTRMPLEWFLETTPREHRIGG